MGETTEQILSKLPKEEALAKILIRCIGVVIALIIFYLGFNYFTYDVSSGEVTQLGSNVKGVYLNNDGTMMNVKLTSVANLENVDAIKFILKSGDSEFIYETSEGISELSYSKKISFLHKILGIKPDASYYDYSVEISKINGLNNFKDVEKVEVYFESEALEEAVEFGVSEEIYKSEEEYKSNVSTVVVKSSFGGGGGGGGSATTTTTTCTPDCSGKTCGDDGCSGSCGGCLVNQTCTNYVCVNNSVSVSGCTSDLNCSGLTGTCGVGKCNLTNGSCYASYNLSSAICRASTGVCDLTEYCSGNSVGCPVDVFANYGTSCTDDEIDCTNDICSSGNCLHLANNSLCEDGEICGVGGCVGEFSIFNTYYVRAGATGTNNGSDWTNAFSSLPSVLKRNYTYYIADGEYSGYSFDDKENGTQYIIIKKATVDEHGTNSGWQNSYGDGQSLFAPLVIINSYYVLDGSVGGGPGSWDSGHGIKIKSSSAGAKLISLRGPSWYTANLPHHINITHVEMEHRGMGYNDSNDDGIYASCSGCGDIASHDIYLAYCYLHDFSRNAILTSTASDWLFEYNYLGRNSCVSPIHSEGWQDFGSSNFIIRNNFFEDNSGTGYIALKKNYDDLNENWSIYGNIFYRTPDFEGIIGGNGVIAAIEGGSGYTTPCNNIKIYNNAFVNLLGYNVGIDFPHGEGNEVYNNIWYGCSARAISMSFEDGKENYHDYNYFYENYRDSNIAEEADYCYSNICSVDLGYLTISGVVDSEEHSLYGDSDPFVDWANGDFSLNEAMEGISLDSEFSIDAFGNIRGSDGIWDRGAIEYS